MSQFREYTKAACCPDLWINSERCRSLQLSHPGCASGHRAWRELEYHVTSAHPAPGSFLPYKLCAQPLGTDPGWSKSVIAVTFPLARNWSKMEIYVCETCVRPMRWMKCKGKCTRDSRKDIPLQLRQRELTGGFPVCPRGFFSILDTVSENMCLEVK